VGGFAVVAAVLVALDRDWDWDCRWDGLAGLVFVGAVDDSGVGICQVQSVGVFSLDEVERLTSGDFVMTGEEVVDRGSREDDDAPCSAFERKAPISDDMEGSSTGGNVIGE
jgi:hypothetical protein